MKKEKTAILVTGAFSLAEALITLLIVCIITIASAPIITKKHRMKYNQPHGMYACYWNGDNLVAKQIVNNKITDGKTIYDSDEGRYACVFNRPSGTKNFTATIIGGGGGGAGAGILSKIERTYFSEPGDHIYTVPATGLYHILGVAAGVGGGYGSGLELRACTGLPSGFVYAKNFMLLKDEQLSVKIPPKGSRARSSTWGMDGGDTVVGYLEQMKNIAPGENEFSHNLANSFLFVSGTGISCSFDSSPEGTYLVAYNEKEVTGNYSNWDNTFIGTYKEFTSLNWQSWIPKIYSYKSNDFASIVPNKINEDELDSGRKYLGKLNSSGHQHGEDYILVEHLEKFRDLFGVPFNTVTEIPGCNKGYGGTGSCKSYSHIYGAGGGGGGKYNGRTFDSKDGGSGFVGFVFNPIYAGRGGKAGQVSQVTLTELPTEVRLFPGKGGRGGIYAAYAPDGKETAGFDGESSFIKNGTVVSGGKGAPAIVHGREDTYAAAGHNDSGMIGEDGELSELVISDKDAKTGGKGGLVNGGNSPDGTTLPVFVNNTQIGDLNKIYGAGAGGGGAGILFELFGKNKRDEGIPYSFKSITAGSGANGSSGLVFIKW